MLIHQINVPVPATLYQKEHRDNEGYRHLSTKKGYQSLYVRDMTTN